MFSKLSKAMLVLASTFVFTTGAYAEWVGGSVYISNITNAEDNTPLSRSLLEFHIDGTVTVSDSDQDGEGNPGGFAPFGVQHGYWKESSCHDVIKLKTVNFQHPKFLTTNWPTGIGTPQNIVVSTATLTRVNSTQYAGEVFLQFFALDANINDSSQALGAPFKAGNIVINKISKP